MTSCLDCAGPMDPVRMLDKTDELGIETEIVGWICRDCGAAWYA